MPSFYRPKFHKFSWGGGYASASLLGAWVEQHTPDFRTAMKWAVLNFSHNDICAHWISVGTYSGTIYSANMDCSKGICRPQILQQKRTYDKRLGIGPPLRVIPNRTLVHARPTSPAKTCMDFWWNHWFCKSATLHNQNGSTFDKSRGTACVQTPWNTDSLPNIPEWFTAARSRKFAYDVTHRPSHPLFPTQLPVVAVVPIPFTVTRVIRRPVSLARRRLGNVKPYICSFTFHERLRAG